MTRVGEFLILFFMERSGFYKTNLLRPAHVKLEDSTFVLFSDLKQ
ncbi:hypothetical protein LEP1GSC127_3154 [Leptospira kirschneri str. 200801925]|uniref:Uncharacterized protein n=1 Tax=Leptospira kirschneri str. 200802841 TaxID=1193047 RepID=A0A828Y2D1_9LEPT|nr:hypothetical protein LEP1GSC131_1662 [Leptospira kirschneri str. 200802841]EKO51315.1 hypothetical protein LEP1GSC131_1865 [Leptospira kirschneri str. 200802841]EMO77326.1 hypothetical protein LEP1GSC127_3154 [Leptospira kirschneri str. 200801925]